MIVWKSQSLRTEKHTLSKRWSSGIR